MQDKAEEEHHAILLLYKTDRSPCRKFIKQMENDMLQKKDPFPKTVADTCWIISGWQNLYGNIQSRLMEANDRVTFTTPDTETTRSIIKKLSPVTNSRRPDIMLMNVRKRITNRKDFQQEGLQYSSIYQG